MRATLKNNCFWHLKKNENKKKFQKLKQFYFVLKTHSFRKYFLNKNILVLKKFIFVSETLSLLFAN